MSTRVTAAAPAVPAAAVAQPTKGKGAEKPAKVDRKKPKKVTFIFKRTFTAPGTIEVLAGNAHTRKGGFVGQAITVGHAVEELVDAIVVWLAAGAGGLASPCARARRACHAARGR
jgi:hypothetical protein